MEARDVKKKLIDLGVTQTQLAKEIGVTVQAVNLFIHGKSESRRIRDYLEIRLGYRPPRQRPAKKSA